ncbi:YCII-related domain protein [compost metagenome]
MRFMLIVKATGYSEARVNPSRDHNDAMIAFKNSLVKAGVLIAAEELQPSSTGIRISYPLHGGEPEMQAGPFPVDQDFIAEYTLIDVRTEDEALIWALRMPVQAGHGKCEIEIRRLEVSSESLQEPRKYAMEADLQEQLKLYCLSLYP